MRATDDVHPSAPARWADFPSLTKGVRGDFLPYALCPSNARAAHGPTSNPPMPPFAKRGDGQEGPSCDRIRSNFWWRQCGNPPILLLPPLKIDGSERDPRLSYSTEMALDPLNGCGRKASPGYMMGSFCIVKNDSESPPVAGSDAAHPMPHGSPENVSSSTNGAFKHRKNDQVSKVGGEDHSP